MPGTPRSWLAGMHRGREHDARALWEAFAPRLIAYASGLIGSHASGHDIVQSVFCTILGMPRSRLLRVRHVEPWLFTLTRHHALDQLRTERRLGNRHQQAGLHACSVNTRIPLSRDEHELTPGALSCALERLPEPMREVVLLRHAGGLGFDTMERVLGINQHTLSSRHRRAIAMLRELLVPSIKADSTDTPCAPAPIAQDQTP